MKVSTYFLIVALIFASFVTVARAEDKDKSTKVTPAITIPVDGVKPINDAFASAQSAQVQAQLAKTSADLANANYRIAFLEAVLKAKGVDLSKLTGEQSKDGSISLTEKGTDTQEKK